MGEIENKSIAKFEAFNAIHKMLCLYANVNCLGQLIMVDQNISCSRKLVISPKISHFCCLTFPLPRFLTSSIYDVVHLSVSKEKT